MVNEIVKMGYGFNPPEKRRAYAEKPDNPLYKAFEDWIEELNDIMKKDFEMGTNGEDIPSFSALDKKFRYALARKHLLKIPDIVSREIDYIYPVLVRHEESEKAIEFGGSFIAAYCEMTDSDPILIDIKLENRFSYDGHAEAGRRVVANGEWKDIVVAGNSLLVNYGEAESLIGKTVINYGRAHSIACTNLINFGEVWGDAIKISHKEFKMSGIFPKGKCLIVNFGSINSCHVRDGSFLANARNIDFLSSSGSYTIANAGEIKGLPKRSLETPLITVSKDGSDPARTREYRTRDRPDVVKDIKLFISYAEKYMEFAEKDWSAVGIDSFEFELNSASEELLKIVGEKLGFYEK